MDRGREGDGCELERGSEVLGQDGRRTGRRVHGAPHDRAGGVSETVSLTNALYACIAGGMVLLAVAIGFVLPNFANELTSRSLENAVRTRSASLAQDLARSLNDDWEKLVAISERIPGLDAETGRIFLDGAASGSNISWAGFAGTDGTVRFATGGLLEGESVATRPWFTAGLRHGFAGDVHEAVLLQSLLAPDVAEPIRFIDLARPVTSETGRTLGVIGLHIDAGWLERYLVESAAARGIDVVLISADGAVASASFDVEGDLSGVDIVRAAGAGASTVTTEDWPNGTRYVSATVPAIAYGDLPSFGWRLVGRIEADTNAVAQEQLLRHVAALALAAGGIFLLATMAYAMVFLRPVLRLIDTAERMSRGEDIYPEETASSAEGSRLGAALARMRAGRAGPTG